MTDSRLGSLAVEALVQGAPDARLGSLSVEGLVQGTPDARVGSMAVEALVSTTVYADVAATRSRTSTATAAAASSTTASGTRTRTSTVTANTTSPANVTATRTRISTLVPRGADLSVTRTRTTTVTANAASPTSVTRTRVRSSTVTARVAADATRTRSRTSTVTAGATTASVRGGWCYTDRTAASVSLAWPSGTVAGDYVILFASDSSTAGRPTLTGWTYLGQAFYYKPLTAADLAGNLVIPLTSTWQLMGAVVTNVGSAPERKSTQSSTSGTLSFGSQAARSVPMVLLHHLYAALAANTAPTIDPAILPLASDGGSPGAGLYDFRTVAVDEQASPGAAPSRTMTFDTSGAFHNGSNVTVVVPLAATGTVSASTSAVRTRTSLVTGVRPLSVRARTSTVAANVSSPAAVTRTRVRVAGAAASLPNIVAFPLTLAVGADSTPEDFPAPDPPAPDIVAPLTLERTVVATRYTYPDPTITDGKVGGGWGPS